MFYRTLSETGLNFGWYCQPSVLVQVVLFHLLDNSGEDEVSPLIHLVCHTLENKKIGLQNERSFVCTFVVSYGRVLYPHCNCVFMELKDCLSWFSSPALVMNRIAAAAVLQHCLCWWKLFVAVGVYYHSLIMEYDGSVIWNPLPDLALHLEQYK